MTTGLAMSVIHVRTWESSRYQPRGSYSALKPLGKGETICGAEPTSYDITPRDVKACLASAQWRDRVCSDCAAATR